MSEQIWHSSNDDPQDVEVGDRIVVVSEYGDGNYADIWTMKEIHGWFSHTEGGSLHVSDCLRWAWERDVIQQAIGGVT